MKPSKGFLVTLFLVLALGVIVLLPPLNQHRPDERMPVWRIEIRNIASALTTYQAIFDSYPTGDSVLISKALRGDNPKKIMLLEARNNGISIKGELLDPWGTPYKIGIVGKTNFVIRSAGPNKKFDEKDDIIFNSVSNDFVKP
jgi:hypothetical protein